MRTVLLAAAVLLATPAAARDAPWLVTVPALAEIARALAGPAARIDLAEDDEAAVTSYCRGLGAQLPDALLLMRRLFDREQGQCRSEAIEVEPARILGTVGLAIGGPLPNLTRGQIWRALAREVSVDGRLEPNRATTWREADPDLPDRPIAVRLAAPASLVDGLILSVGCLGAPSFAELDRARLCRGLRAGLPDGPDPVIIEPLRPDGLPVEGVRPTPADVVSGRYPLARRIYLFTKRPHLPGIPGLANLRTREVQGVAPAP